MEPAVGVEPTTLGLRYRISLLATSVVPASRAPKPSKWCVFLAIHGKNLLSGRSAATRRWRGRPPFLAETPAIVRTGFEPGFRPWHGIGETSVLCFGCPEFVCPRVRWVIDAFSVPSR